MVGVNQNDLLHVQEWPLVTVRMDITIKDVIKVMRMDECGRWNDLKTLKHFTKK